MEQLQKHRQKSRDDESGAYLQDHPLDAAERNISDEEVDDLLSEVDKVLEPNAQDFVRAFVQEGGQ